MPSADTVLFVLLLVVLATVAAWLRRRFAGPRYPTGDLPYFSRGYQLSKGETAFFHALRQAVPPGLMIAPMVRVSDVIGCDASAWKRGFGGRISQKHGDFVLVDAQTTAFELIIELDDKSHRAGDGMISSTGRWRRRASLFFAYRRRPVTTPRICGRGLYRSWSP